MLLTLSTLRNLCAFMLIVAVCVLNYTNVSDIIIGGLVTASFLLHINNIGFYIGYKLLFLVLSLCSIVVGITFGHTPEFFRIITLTLIIAAFPYHVSLSRMHYIGLLAVAIYLFAMQLGYGYFQIAFVKEFIDSFYPISRFGYDDGSKTSWSAYEDPSLGLADTRYAGIFYNPNIMGQTMLFLYACLLPYMQARQLLTNMAIYMIFLSSVAFTGSRTATIIMLVLGFFSFIKQLNFVKFLLLLAAVMILAFVFLDSVGILRGLNVVGLFDGSDLSGRGKIRYMLLLWDKIFSNETDFFVWLFGIGKEVTFYDFDLGYMFEIFGVLGIILIISLLIAIYRDTLQTYRYVFFLFLISVGTTVIINFRFSILIFIVLSLYNSRNQQLLKKRQGVDSYTVNDTVSARFRLRH